MSTCEPYTCEDVSSEEEERRGNRRWREVSGVSDEGRMQAGQMKGASYRDRKGFVKADTQQRYRSPQAFKYIIYLQNPFLKSYSSLQIHITIQLSALNISFDLISFYFHLSMYPLNSMQMSA